MIILADIKSIIAHSKERAIRSVDFERVLMYWKIGERIVVEEQEGKERARYGEKLIESLAEDLEPQYGSSFSFRQLTCLGSFIVNSQL